MGSAHQGHTRNVPDIPGRIVERVREGKAVLFVGAGPSMASGYPSWHQLVESLVAFTLKDIGEHRFRQELDLLIKRNEYLKLCNICQRKLGSEGWEIFWHHCFRDLDAQPTPVHKAIAANQWMGILTTNYDKLIEMAFKGQRKLRVVTTPHATNLDYLLQGEESFLIKLHGDIDAPTSIVISQEDYSRVYESQGQIQRFLEQVVAQYTVIMAGFSLKDPFLNGLLRRFHIKTKGEHARPYALFAETGMRELEKDEFMQSHGIEVLLYHNQTGNHEGLIDFFSALATLTSEPPNDEGNRVPAGTVESERAIRERILVESARRVCIGVDLGSTNIRGCVLDPAVSRPQLSSEQTDLQAVRKPATHRSVLKQIEEMIKGLLLREPCSKDKVRGIGLAVPGQVNVRLGILKFSPGLNLRNVPLRSSLQRKFNLDVRVDNDARCATRCELRFGTGRAYRDFVCIFIGTGVGGGIVIDNRIYYGHNYCAGEIGHTKIDTKGPACNCGRSGCLEAFVNGPAIAESARAKVRLYKTQGKKTILERYGDALDASNVAEAMVERDAAAIEVVDEIAMLIGQGLANCINLMNPAAIVLGGGVMSGLYQHMADKIQEAIDKHALNELINTAVSQSAFGDDGAAIGAALMFHEDEKWEF